MSFKDNVFPAQDPSSGLILVTDRKGVVQPVGYVSAPLPSVSKLAEIGVT